VAPEPSVAGMAVEKSSRYAAGDPPSSTHAHGAVVHPQFGNASRGTPATEKGESAWTSETFFFEREAGTANLTTRASTGLAPSR